MIANNVKMIQTKNIPSTELGKELGMLNIETGKYYSVNNVGARIWKFLESGVTFEELVIELQKIYEVDQETCEVEVRAFLGRLEEESLIATVEA